MMRPRKTESQLDQETGQLSMRIRHEDETIENVIHSLLSQREAYIELSSLQRKYIASLEKELSLTVQTQQKIKTPQEIEQMEKKLEFI
jgi:hypothetical protein